MLPKIHTRSSVAASVAVVCAIVFTPRVSAAQSKVAKANATTEQVLLIEPRPMRNVASRKTDVRLVRDAVRYGKLLRKIVRNLPGLTVVTGPAARTILGDYYRADIFKCREASRCILKRVAKAKRPGARYILIASFTHHRDGARVFFDIKLIDMNQKRAVGSLSRLLPRNAARLETSLARGISALFKDAASQPDEANGLASDDLKLPALGEAKTPIKDAAAGDSSFDDAWDLQATGGFEDITAEEVLEESTVEYGGRIGSEVLAYSRKVNGRRDVQRARVDLGFTAKAGIPWATAFGSFLARRDLGDSTRDRLDIEEAYIDVNNQRFALRAGFLMESWGKANLFNPTDVLNPVDMRDLLDPEKLGTLMLRARAFVGPLLIEGYILPAFESHRFPTADGLDGNGQLMSNNRWFVPPSPTINGLPAAYQFPTISNPAANLDNIEGGLRLSMSFAGVDLSAAYLVLTDRFPTVETSVQMLAGPPSASVTTDLTYRRIHVITGDFERAFGGLRVAGEAIVVRTEDNSAVDPQVVNPFITGVIGFDYRTPQFAGDMSMHFFIEYYGSRALSGRLESSVPFLRFPFNQAVLSRIRYEAKTNLRFDLDIVYSLDATDYLLYPRMEYVYNDLVTFEIGYQSLHGTDNRFFGRFRRNSRAVTSMELRY